MVQRCLRHRDLVGVYGERERGREREREEICGMKP